MSNKLAVSLGVICLVGLGACELPGFDDALCPDGSKGSMAATVDGDGYDSCYTEATKAGTTLNITGQSFPDGVSTQMAINIQADAVGSFEMGGASAAQNTGRYSATTDVYITGVEPNVGTVEITQIDDTKVVGSFSFTAAIGGNGASSVEVTEGSFDVNFE